MKIKIKDFLYNLKNNRFWGNVLLLSSGSVLAQSIGIFTTPIVSRLYTPFDFGEYAIIISTSSILFSIYSLGLNSAIMLTKNDDETKKLFSTSLVLSLSILSTIVLLGAFVFKFNPTTFNLYTFWLLIFLHSISIHLVSLLSILANKNGLYKVLFTNSLITASITIIVTIPLGVLKIGSIGLIIASIIANMIASIQMWLRTKANVKIVSIKEIIITIKRFKDFVLFLFPSNFVENFANQLPNQYLSNVFGSGNLGLYNMNEKLLGIPSRIIGAPINTVYFKLSREHVLDKKKLSMITFSLITKVMLLALIPFVILSFYGEEIFRTFLGEQWSEAGKISSILIASYIYVFASTCVSYLRVSLEKQKVTLGLSAVRIIFILSAFALSYTLKLDIYQTLIFYSIGTIMYHIVDMYINFILLKHFQIKYLVFSIGYLTFISLIWIFTGVFDIINF